MVKQINSQKNLTKKDLIKILEKIDLERTKRNLANYYPEKKSIKN